MPKKNQKKTKRKSSKKPAQADVRKNFEQALENFEKKRTQEIIKSDLSLAEFLFSDANKIIRNIDEIREFFKVLPDSKKRFDKICANNFEFFARMFFDYEKIEINYDKIAQFLEIFPEIEAQYLDFFHENQDNPLIFSEYSQQIAEFRKYKKAYAGFNAAMALNKEQKAIRIKELVSDLIPSLIEIHHKSFPYEDYQDDNLGRKTLENYKNNLLLYAYHHADEFAKQLKANNFEFFNYLLFYSSARNFTKQANQNVLFANTLFLLYALEEVFKSAKSGKVMLGGEITQEDEKLILGYLKFLREGVDKESIFHPNMQTVEEVAKVNSKNFVGTKIRVNDHQEINVGGDQVSFAEYFKQFFQDLALNKSKMSDWSKSEVESFYFEKFRVAAYLFISYVQNTESSVILKRIKADDFKFFKDILKEYYLNKHLLGEDKELMQDSVIRYINDNLRYLIELNVVNSLDTDNLRYVSEYFKMTSDYIFDDEIDINIDELLFPKFFPDLFELYQEILSEEVISHKKVDSMLETLRKVDQQSLHEYLKEDKKLFPLLLKKSAELTKNGDFNVLLTTVSFFSAVKILGADSRKKSNSQENTTESVTSEKNYSQQEIEAVKMNDPVPESGAKSQLSDNNVRAKFDLSALTHPLTGVDNVKKTEFLEELFINHEDQDEQVLAESDLKDNKIDLESPNTTMNRSLFSSIKIKNTETAHEK